MAYSPEQKIRIRADYESGKVTKMDMSKKWRISRQGLENLAKKDSWIFASKLTELDTIIHKKAEEKIVATETKKIVDYTSDHLKQVTNLRQLSKANAIALSKAVKDSNNVVSKVEADRIFATQKVIKISSETLDILYKSERLAMGFKDSDTPPVVINVGNVQDLKQVSDNNLEIMVSEIN